MKIMKTFITCTLALVLVGCSGTSSSADSKINNFYGETTITIDGETSGVYEGVSVTEGASITVGSDAFLQVELSNGDILYIGEETILTINTIDSTVSINLYDGYLLVEASSNDEYAIETVNSMVTSSDGLFGVYCYDGGYTGLSRAYCFTGELAMMGTNEASDAYQEYSCEAGYNFEISGLDQYATFVSSSNDDVEYKEMELRSLVSEMVRLLGIQSDVGSIEGCYSNEEIMEEASTQGVDFTTYTLTTVVDGTETTYTYLAGSKFTLANPELEGYTFDGWYLDEDCSVYNYSSYIKEDMYLYASFIQE